MKGHVITVTIKNVRTVAGPIMSVIIVGQKEIFTQLKISLQIMIQIKI